MTVVLVEASRVQVGDQVIPEEYDPSLGEDWYDPECAVEVVAVSDERGYRAITVRFGAEEDAPTEIWKGYPEQRLLAVR